ncbi:conserved hypothetical protein [uncultured Alphaproteobacteria bacterium]|uniref:Lipoprotein n=1 Tax=uncultured Alphaproteobacteria bacterium TaxID=91750 RepID=A0A212KLL8_9PROT|nr:conserved hypothetical protein [uncultured Alphaproteobacteria bacterium]
MSRRFDLGLAARGAALLVALGGLAGCGIFDKKEPPAPCPQVRIDRDTAKITRFQGSGTDVTDTLIEAEITGYTGTCEVRPDDHEVLMTLNATFLATVGPATPAQPDGSRKQRFKYFVALPDFYPHPAGKQVFETEVTFPPNVNQVRYRDAEVALKIPLTKSVSSGDVRVYLGMQLDRDQLEFNRRNQPQY